MRLNSASVAVFALLVASIAVPRILAAPHYEPWSTPVNLGAPVNSRFSETKATLSRNGLSLYFASNRPSGAGDAVLDANMWVAHRSLPAGPWETAECLSISADTTISGLPVYEDSAPTLSRDEHWLYFVSDRPGGFGSPGFFGRDIWVSWRSDVHDDQGWGEPFNMGAPVNTTAAETGPAYFENDDEGLPKLFFISTRSGLSGLFDVWVVDVVDGVAAGPATRVDEVNTNALVEAGASVRHDGLELLFFRGVPGAVFDIYATTRPDVFTAWSEPVNLGQPVSTSANEQSPSLSPDGRTLFVAANRPGSIAATSGLPSIDIWMFGRAKSDHWE